MSYCPCTQQKIANKMFSSFSGALQTAADVLAPPPTPMQDFEYHWKQFKNFYTPASDQEQPKKHVNDTTLPAHLESMLQIVIQEDADRKNNSSGKDSDDNGPSECLEFILTNRPLDLLADLAYNDSPPGSTVCVLKWIRRYLSCVDNCRLDHESIFQPVQKLIQLCNLSRASPYEEEEIVFLSTVAGLVRKDPFLLNLFLPTHQHSAYVLNSRTATGRTMKTPSKNTLFDCSQIEANIRRIAIARDEDTASVGTTTAEDSYFEDVFQLPDDGSTDKFEPVAEIDEFPSSSTRNVNESGLMDNCDCDFDDRLFLLDAILGYFESALTATLNLSRCQSGFRPTHSTLSALMKITLDINTGFELNQVSATILMDFSKAFDSDNIVVVRACEGALILCSLPSVNINCRAMQGSFEAFSKKLAEKLTTLCQQIPDDMDAGDIEDCNVSWGLAPRDVEAQHFVGRLQINEFFSWLDYGNCLAKECPELSIGLCEQIRIFLLENYIEPAVLDVNASFMLVLIAKIIRQIDAKQFSDELANWLLGTEDEPEIGNDCLLTIIIENAQGNSDILLPTLQFIESLLDNTNERILNGMIFRYINSRGYYDISSLPVQTWSDEEDERERRRGSVDGPPKSKTMAPANILKVINHFLLLLPRQIVSECLGGTCYEEYVQDANRHYQNWIQRTSSFRSWPVEAFFPYKDDDNDPDCDSVSPSTSATVLRQAGGRRKTAGNNDEVQCSDSGISEEAFFEGPLLRMLFVHVKNMALHPYELNLAVVAILSKLAFLPHPYLHEILLNPEIPVAPGTNTLWSSMQTLARLLLLQVPLREGFQQKLAETGKRLLTNPPTINDNDGCTDPLFESIVVLEEFCKELAAIAFVKYHYATE